MSSPYTPSVSPSPTALEFSTPAKVKDNESTATHEGHALTSMVEPLSGDSILDRTSNKDPTSPSLSTTDADIVNPVRDSALLWPGLHGSSPRDLPIDSRRRSLSSQSQSTIPPPPIPDYPIPDHDSIIDDFLSSLDDVVEQSMEDKQPQPSLPTMPPLLSYINLTRPAIGDYVALAYGETDLRIGRPIMTIARVQSIDEESSMCSVHIHGPLPVLSKSSVIRYATHYIHHGRLVSSECMPDTNSLPAICKVDIHNLYLIKQYVQSHDSHVVSLHLDAYHKMEAQADMLYHDPITAYACTAEEFNANPKLQPVESLWSTCVLQSDHDTAFTDCIRNIQHVKQKSFERWKDPPPHTASTKKASHPLNTSKEEDPRDDSTRAPTNTEASDKASVITDDNEDKDNPPPPPPHDDDYDEPIFEFIVTKPSWKDTSRDASIQRAMYTSVNSAPYLSTSKTQACDGVIGEAKRVVLRSLTVHERMLCQEAIDKEVKSFVSNGVLLPVSKNEYITADKLEGTKPIRLKFIFEWKSVDGVKTMKARLVAEGTLRNDPRKDLKTSVSIPTLKALRVLQLITLQRNDYKPDDIRQADMKTSFLQAPELTPTWYIKPKLAPGFNCSELDGLFGDTGLAKGLKTVYGQRNASYGLDVFVRDRIVSEGFIELRSVRQVYVRFTLKGKTYAQTMAIPADQRSTFKLEDWCIDAWLYAYVDDFQAGPGSEHGTLGADVIKSLGLKIKFKEEPAVLGKFQGIHMHATEAGIWWDQHAQAKGAYPKAKTVKAQHPLMTSVDIHKRFAASPILDEKEHTQYRKILGSLGYLAHTRLDLLYPITLMSQYAHEPTQEALAAIQRIGSYAYSTASRGLFLPAANAVGKVSLINDRSWATTKTQVPASSPLAANVDQNKAGYHLDLITDASHGDKSVSGYIILLNGAPICYRSYTQRRVCNSSTAAEVQALYDGTDALAATAFLLKELGITDISTAIWVDSNNLVSGVHKVNPTVSEQSTLLQLRQIQDVCVHAAYPAATPDMEGNGAPFDPMQVHSSDVGPIASRWVTLSHPANILRAVEGVNSTIINLKANVYHLAGSVNPADPLTKAMKIDNLLNTVLHTYEDFLDASKTLNPDVKSMLLEEEAEEVIPDLFSIDEDGDDVNDFWVHYDYSLSQTCEAYYVDMGTTMGDPVPVTPIRPSRVRFADNHTVHLLPPENEDLMLVRDRVLSLPPNVKTSMHFEIKTPRLHVKGNDLAQLIELASNIKLLCKAMGVKIDIA